MKKILLSIIILLFTTNTFAQRDTVFNINIYPNPTYKRLVVEFDSINLGKIILNDKHNILFEQLKKKNAMMLQIFDLNGRILFIDKIRAEQLKYDTDLYFLRGTYIIKVGQQVYKFIKIS